MHFRRYAQQRRLSWRLNIELQNSKKVLWRYYGGIKTFLAPYSHIRDSGESNSLRCTSNSIRAPVRVAINGIQHSFQGRSRTLLQWPTEVTGILNDVLVQSNLTSDPGQVRIAAD
jgi:hypothetical protein